MKQIVKNIMLHLGYKSGMDYQVELIVTKHTHYITITDNRHGFDIGLLEDDAFKQLDGIIDDLHIKINSNNT